MAAPVFTKSFTQDIQQEIKARHCGGLMFTGDALSDTISVALYDNGVPASVSGTVVCNVIRADGATIPITGVMSGNVAQATLTQVCFAIVGPLTIIMKISSGGTITTILKAVYTVDVGETGTIVDPGTVIPNVSALITDIETAENNIDKLAKALVGAGFYIAVQPQDVYGAVGDTVTMSVDVLAADLYHSTPAPVSVTYQWQYRLINSSGSWTNSALSGFNTRQLSIPVIATRYNYDWRCAVTGNGVTEYSESARILEPVSNDATEGTE